jgi:membrane protein
VKEKILQIYNFFSDDTPYFAASLSFFTIFSILPLIALLISVVSKLPNFNEHLDLMMFYIMDFINPTHSQTLAQNLNSFLVNMEDLGSIGIFYLLFVFTMFFRDYEHVVNKIFGTPTRPIYKMFFMYITLMLMIPLLVMIFVFVSTLLSKLSYSVHILTFLFIWVIFILLFQLSANTKISFKATALSSLITFIGLSLVKNLFGIYVSSNTTYSTIYGSFSIALFFFLYIYISWSIYLYGMKLCSVLNNLGDAHEQE